MTCSVFNTDESQAIYIYNDNTNFDPLSPPAASTNNDVLTVKNQLFLSIITTAGTLVLTDIGDNTEAISTAAESGKKFNVTLDGRTLYKDGEWNTLCLPFNTTKTGLLADATIMELDVDGKYDENDRPDANGAYQTILDADGTLHLFFKDADAISAGVPYIIKWANSGEELENPVFENVLINSTASTSVSFTGGQFLGSYSSQSFSGQNKSILFLGEDGKTLVWPENGAKIGAFRANFDLGNNSVRAFHLNLGDSKASGIMTINITDGAGNWYSVNGMKLNGAPKKKGLYIHNGTKVIIK
jgi:hypothetical protein